MSASDSNTETQVKRHRPAIIGIAVALAIAAIAALVMAYADLPATEQATPVPTERATPE